MLAGVKRKVSAIDQHPLLRLCADGKHAGLAIARVAADEAAEADKVMEG